MMNESMEVRIGRYLAGEADIHERESFERDMETDPSLRQQFLLYQKIWQNSHIPSDTSWNADKGWQKFNEISLVSATESPVRRTIGLRWGIAAALVVAFGALFLLWNARKPNLYAFEPGGANQVVLTDGSKIYLNEGATVTVHSFKRKMREVDLEGEAYFEVNPNPNKPFMVQAGETLTEVMGTAFNIETVGDQTSIFVADGKVIFRAQKNVEQAVALTSGEAAFFKDEKVQRIVNPSPNIHSWHSKELSFQNMTLADIMADVQSYFKYEVFFENKNVQNCPITASLAFKEPKIESVLKSVLASINATYVMEGQKCTIKGGDCTFN